MFLVQSPSAQSILLTESDVVVSSWVGGGGWEVIKHKNKTI